MARKLLAGVVVVAALGAVTPAAADQLPLLRAAKAAQRHLVLQLSVGDARPVELVVATRRAVDADGALLQKNVRLREVIKLPSAASGIVRWESSAKLRPGIYFVQVTAVQTGGVTDCPPKQLNCAEHWSNVRRVVVPRPS